MALGSLAPWARRPTTTPRESDVIVTRGRGCRLRQGRVVAHPRCLRSQFGCLVARGFWMGGCARRGWNCAPRPRWRLAALLGRAPRWAATTAAGTQDVRDLFQGLCRRHPAVDYLADNCGELMRIEIYERAVQESEATHADRLVLLHLAMRANAQGLAWPRVDDICLATRLTERTVRRALSALRKSGDIVVVSAGGQGANVWRSTRYLVKIGMEPAKFRGVAEKFRATNALNNRDGGLSRFPASAGKMDRGGLSRLHPASKEAGKKKIKIRGRGAYAREAPRSTCGSGGFVMSGSEGDAVAKLARQILPDGSAPRHLGPAQRNAERQRLGRLLRKFGPPVRERALVAEFASHLRTGREGAVSADAWPGPSLLAGLAEAVADAAGWLGPVSAEMAAHARLSRADRIRLGEPAPGGVSHEPAERLCEERPVSPEEILVGGSPFSPRLRDDRLEAPRVSRGLTEREDGQPEALKPRAA